MVSRKITSWGSVAFCTFLSILALIGIVTEQMWDNFGGWWKPAFFAFLPMCFFGIACTTSAMQREIDDLQRRLKDYEFQEHVRTQAKV